MNYRNLLILGIIVITLIGLEAIAIGASAADANMTNTNMSISSVPAAPVESYIIESLEPLPKFVNENPYKNNTRITQGQCVEIGGTYDVSGVIGWSTTTDYNAFSYYNRYEDAYDPTDNNSVSYIYKMPNKRIGYYQFTFENDVFSDRQGYWYQYTGTYERSANKRAFYVSDKCIRSINESNFTDVNDEPILLNPKVIETRHVSDILLSNDDPLVINKNGTYRLWVFGRDDSVMSKEINGSESDFTLDTKSTGVLSEGSYSVVTQTVGEDMRYGVDYEINGRSAYKENLLVPALRSQEIVNIDGLQPIMIGDTLVKMLTKTDDAVSTYKMDVQEPSVEISGYQELRMGNVSVLEVTGYTNKIPGTPVTLYINRDNKTKTADKYPSMTVMVEYGDIGDYRTFHGYLPLVYGEFAKGEYQLEAVLPNGKKSQVSFYIREEPKPHYTQPVYYKFVDGDPFYVPPEPVIIEKEVIREVTKVVVNETTVYIPVDYNTLAEETLRKAIPYVLIGVLLIIPVGYSVLLAIRVFAERRLRNRKVG